MARVLRVAGAIGSMVRLFSFAFLPSALLALWYDNYEIVVMGVAMPRALPIFVGCGLAAFIGGSLLSKLGGREPMRDQDAYLTVGSGWLLLCLIAMLPFILEGVLVNPIDAFFEAMSGMTTTGASVITGDYELVPPSLMLWRAMLQFIGGMGIVVLSVAVFAKLTNGGMQLMQAEAPGPSVQRIAPRIGHTARILWTTYAGLAAALFVVVLIVLMRHSLGFKETLYEALILTLTTISTGGFGAHTTSIAYFHDGVLEVVLAIFMLLSGMNFTLHYYALRGRPSAFWRDPEWRFYMGTFVIVTLAVTGILAQAGLGVGEGLRGAFFTVASLITSTGFATVDFDQWPSAAKFLLLIVMLTGATSGSTGGGIKHIRVLLIFKVIATHLRQVLRPRNANPVRIGMRTVAPATITAAGAFLVAFLGLWLAGTLLLTLFDPAFSNVMDATGATVSALSNMGPGFGVVGPTMDYAAISPFSKLVLAMEMWMGRLEIFAAWLVFMPEAWKH